MSLVEGWGGGMGEIGPQQMSWPIFVTYRSGLHVVSSLLQRRWALLVVGGSLRWRWVEGWWVDGWHKEMRKTNHDEIVVCFRDVLTGPPTSWVPPGVYPSPNPASNELEPPIPLERGGADAMGLAFPSEFRHLNLSPHPSIEGRGSVQGCGIRLRAKMGGESEGWW